MRRGTYSIVARDPETGELGVAVQSHWFNVGSVVGWAEPGVGAVATQSLARVEYGPELLADLRAGRTPAEALDERLDADELAHVRQVAAVDATGRIAVHTGPGCIAEAGHVRGDGFSCQANMMARPGVADAMATAYQAGRGDLAERLMLALEAAQAHGGDVRGQQSAALRVVPAAGPAWTPGIDVRVDDHREPLGELRRLLTLARAYALAEEADELLGQGRHTEAGERYAEAARLAPEADELLFWAGLATAEWDLEAGVEQVRRAAAVKESWIALLDRLPVELAPAAEAVRAALGRA